MVEYNPNVDVERQLEAIEKGIAAGKELLDNVDTIKRDLYKMIQRRNQLKLLCDIHRGKLRVHRNDTGEQVPVRFW